MSDILEGLDGVICRMDEILTHGRKHMEHDARVRAVLFRLQRAGLTWNIQKDEFSQGRPKFLGHIDGTNGVHADPEKTGAIPDGSKSNFSQHKLQRVWSDLPKSYLQPMVYQI